MKFLWRKINFHLRKYIWEQGTYVYSIYKTFFKYLRHSTEKDQGFNIKSEGMWIKKTKLEFENQCSNEY